MEEKSRRLTIFERIDGEVEALCVVVGVPDGNGWEFLPEPMNLPAEKSVVVPRQGVELPRAPGLGAVVFRIGGVVERQIQREAADRQHRRHDKIHSTEADQSLSIPTALINFTIRIFRSVAIQGEVDVFLDLLRRPRRRPG